MLNPQPLRKPTAIPEPVPTRGANVFLFAATRSPPGPPFPFLVGSSKLKTNCLSSGRRVYRSAAESARKSCLVISEGRGAAGALSDLVDGAEVLTLLGAEDAVLTMLGAGAGAALAMKAMMATATAVELTSILNIR